ncbi:MAG: hypothetical protein Q8K99_06130 [Actinomycetota bacterium]|nr:hypothetical protein [Actinomycetota bacterium]
MFGLLMTAVATMLLALSLVGVVAGGIKSGGAMSRYSSGIRQTAEDFQNVDLDRVQRDQRTAPLEAATGLAEAALSAQTIGSPDVAKNPVGLGFTDGMSLGQLAVGYAEESASGSSGASGATDDGDAPSAGESGGGSGAGSQTGSSGGGGTPVEQAAPTTYVAWYADNIGFKPIWITSIEVFREDSPASSWPGGGLDPNVPLKKVALTGAYATGGEALDAIGGMLSNRRMGGGIYAGMPLADIGGEAHNMENVDWKRVWE